MFECETTSFHCFSPRIEKTKKFGHWTSGSGGKKTFQRSKQMKKICKKLLSPRRFYTLYEQKFSNLRPLLSITFLKGFRKSKKFGHWTLGIGGKKTVKQYLKSEQTIKQTHTHIDKSTYGDIA